MDMRKGIPAEYHSYLSTRHSTTVRPEQRQGLSLRGLWTGLYLSLFLAIGAPYADTAMHASFMAWDFNTPGAIFLFLLLIGGINALHKITARSIGRAAGLATACLLLYLGYYLPAESLDPLSPGLIFNSSLVGSSVLNAVMVARGRTLALNRSELILVYVMLLIVSALCSMGMSEYLMPTIAAFFYYASPENQWMEKLLPHLPDHTVLVNDGNDNRAFFEGVAGAGEQIPVQAWIEPLCWWAVFLLALYVAMISTAVILRRQWMNRERLAYPIAQVALTMIQGEDETRLVNRFFTHPLMWVGCALPLAIGSLRAIHGYVPTVPFFRLVWADPFFPSPQQLRLNFAIMGFSYLINTSVSAGLWIFHLLCKIEGELLLLTGVRSSQKFVYGIADQPYLAFQNGGALIVMVLVSLWTGRQHFGNVLRKALGRAPEVDDSDEIMSYRAAVAGLLGGVGVMCGWLWVMGTPVWVAALFVCLAMVIFVGITRVVAEAGIAAVRSPLIAPDLMIQGLGSSLIGSSGVFNLSLAYIWCADIRVFVMGMCANGLRLIEEMDLGSRRRVFWFLLLAVLVGGIGSCWMVFHMAHRHGGINLVGWFFKGGPVVVFDSAVRYMEPKGVAWDGLGFLVGGGGAMMLLSWLRHHLSWWPLHPIGLAVAGNHVMSLIWFSVFLAWGAKKLVLRLGGPSAYRRSVYFFLGLIVGEALCTGLWIIIDYVTGKMGNRLFAI
ncbi:MAG: hypothetical protein CME04_04020 [Gemmatimonadaceae bacterium]|jgi:hypothetical protein|nr:hypothetical protein [Gemmatimonadaceae bacterium]